MGWKSWALLTAAVLSTVVAFFCLTPFLPDDWAMEFFTLALILVTAHYAVTTARMSKATEQTANAISQEWQAKAEPRVQLSIRCSDTFKEDHEIICTIASKSDIPVSVKDICVQIAGGEPLARRIFEKGEYELAQGDIEKIRLWVPRLNINEEVGGFFSLEAIVAIESAAGEATQLSCYLPIEGRPIVATPPSQ